jgi:hypothetical protein
VDDGTHYALRPPELAHISALEFKLCYGIKRLGVKKMAEWEAECAGPVKAGRPKLWYKFHCDHALYETHVCVRLAKWGAPALCGNLPSAIDDAGAGYYLALFKPWSVDAPLDGLEGAGASDALEAFLEDLEGDALCPLLAPCGGEKDPSEEAPFDCNWKDEGVLHLPARRAFLEANPCSSKWSAERRRMRNVAHGRLWVIEHCLQGFGGVARLQTMLVSKRRASFRTLWGTNHPKPAGLQPGASAAAHKAAEKAIREALEQKEARLNGTGDLAKRLQAAERLQGWGDRVAGTLASLNGSLADAGSDAAQQIMPAGEALRTQWKAAAEPVGAAARPYGRTLQRYDEALDALRLPLPVKAVEALPEAEAAAAAAAGAGREDVGEPFSAGALAEISQSQYEQLRDEWLAAKAAAEAARVEFQSPPPFCVEQREVGRLVVEAARVRHQALQAGCSASEAHGRIGQAGGHAAVMMMGPGGVGKSAIIEHIIEAVQGEGLGKVVVTAYSGVAAALFGGPILMALINLNLQSKAVKTCCDLDPAQTEVLRKKWLVECGSEASELAVLVVDEISFCDDEIIGHLEWRLRHLTGNLDVFAGGVVLLFAGDNFQKKPPGGVPWYHELVGAATGKLKPEGAAAMANPRSTKGRGLRALRRFKLVELWRILRALSDPAFAESQMAARRLDVSDPFAQSGLLDRVRVLSRQDCTSDESWRFAPVGVLSHVERDFGNAAQVSNFARAFDLPLIRWRLPLMPEARALLEELSDEDLDRLYAAEPALWGYFCEGAPLLIPESIRSTRKLVNGSPGLLYSLVYEGNTVPPEVLRAQRQGGHVVIDLDVAPVGVMARMSGALWHGVKLPDLSSLVETQVDGAVVIPLGRRTKVDEADVYSMVAAQLGLPSKLRVVSLNYQLAFFLTDFKLQGRTLPKLLISLGKRVQMPWMDAEALYVLLSRAMALEGLRFLECDASELRKAKSLRWSDELAVWRQGYGEDGIWSDERCKDAAQRRAAVTKQMAEAAKEARPHEQLRLAELQARCKKLNLNLKGTRAVLISRLKNAVNVNAVDGVEPLPSKPGAPEPAPELAPKPPPELAPKPPPEPVQPPVQPLDAPARQKRSPPPPHSPTAGRARSASPDVPKSSGSASKRRRTHDQHLDVHAVCLDAYVEAEAASGAERVDPAEAILRLEAFRRSQAAFGAYDDARRSRERKRKRQDQADSRRVNLLAVERENAALVTTACATEHFPFAWPRFPAPGNWTRLSYPDLRMEARIVDFYGGCRVSDDLRDYLHAIGFEVPAVDRSTSQYKLTCGIVSGKVSCLMFGAPDWRSADVRSSVHDHVTAFANAQCKLFSDQEMTEAVRQRRRPLSRYLNMTEVDAVTMAFFEQDWAEAARQLEPQGPPCDRCGAGHPSRRCPDIREARKPTVDNWHDTVSRDACIAGVARDLMFVRATGNSRMRIVTCSDAASSGSGSHFFTVAYRIAPILAPTGGLHVP